MQTEVEAKFLNVHHDALRKALKRVGAKLIHPMRTMKRINMDYPDRKLEKQQNGWLRIRDEGNRTTLTYKQVDSWDINGMKEAETVVSNFTTTQQILECIGLTVKSHAESKRETWSLAGAEIVLDEWPWVRPFCEIEADDEVTVKAAIELLGLNWQDAIFGSIEPVYRAEYNITDPEFYTISDFTFGNPTPELLQNRKRAKAVHPQTVGQGQNYS